MPQGILAGMKNNRKKRKKSRLLRFVLFMLVFTVVLLGGWYFIAGRLYDKMNYQAAGEHDAKPWKKDGVVNILLIGNDSRENGEDGRSDAMILLSISDKTRKIYMTSILRDIYVEIPGHGGSRLNAAYAYGGPELLMETIEQDRKSVV